MITILAYLLAACVVAYGTYREICVYRVWRKTRLERDDYEFQSERGLW